MVASGSTATMSSGDDGSPNEVARKMRRVKLFLRAGFLDECNFGGYVTRATTTEHLLAAYGLVHEVYVEEGYITAESSGIRLRPFEAIQEMATFVGVVDGEVVAVMSIVPDSPELGLPADKAFHPELDALRSAGRSIAEVTNLAIKHEYRKTSLFFDLIRPCFAQSMNWGCDNVFIAVSPRHESFFKDVLQFGPWGGQRDYSDEVTDIVTGMTMDFRTIERAFIETDRQLGKDAFLHQRFFTGNPYYRRCGEWCGPVARAFGDPDFLRTMFLDAADLRNYCSWTQLEAIKRRWGPKVFDAVFGENQQASPLAGAQTRSALAPSYI